MDYYIANNGNTLHPLLTIKVGLMLFFLHLRGKKNNNKNILNPLLRPPLSSKPSFSVEESFNNKPPSLLNPIPPPPFSYSSLVNKRLYQSMTTVKLCVERSRKVYSPTGSSDLFLILGCLTSNLLVLGLFHLAFFLWGTNTSVFALD